MSTTQDIPSESPEKHYTVGQVASAMNVKPATVREWLREELLVGFKINSRDWRIAESELKAFIERKYQS